MKMKAIGPRGWAFIAPLESANVNFQNNCRPYKGLNPGHLFSSELIYDVFCACLRMDPNSCMGDFVEFI